MQAATELDLPFLATDQSWFAENPYPHFAEARKAHEWLAASPYGYVVTDYFAMRELALMHGHFRPPHRENVELMGAAGTAWGNFIVDSVQAAPDDKHKRLRDTVAMAFTPREANRQRGVMVAVITRLLDEWAPKRAFDFEEFASYFPITVFCGMVGASPDLVPGIRKSMEAIGQGFSLNKDLVPALQAAMVVMQEFVEALVAGRRRGERPSAERDLLDTLLEAVSGGQMSDDELFNMLIFLFVAGYDTSKNVLTMNMSLMIDRPEIYRRCATDKDYCRKVVEETFRYVNPVTQSRVLDRELVYRDVSFPKDSAIFFPWSMATRDPRAVDDPESFDPLRPQRNAHMGFGLGPRICLGRFIALAQIEEGLHLIAQRILNPRRTGPSGWRGFLSTWGLKGLPIEFDTI
jgi:cytochrome P450